MKTDALLTQLEALTARIHTLETRPARIAKGTEESVPLPRARGTGDVTAKAAQAKAIAGKYFVGDDGPTADLMAVIHLLLAEKPSTFREIVEATGAGENRIKGSLVRLQRDGANVVNLGTQTKAIWFIPGKEAMKRLNAIKSARR